MSQRRQLGGGADRAGHKARLVFRGELLCDFLRNLRGGDVDLRDLVLQVDTRPARRGSPPKVLVSTTSQPTLKKVGVNVLNNVRPAEHQQFVAAFLAPEIVQRGVAELDVGPHGAVVDDDAVAHGLEKVSH